MELSDDYFIFSAKIHYYVSFSRRIAARFAIAQKIAHTETSAQKKSSQKRIRNAIKIPKQQVVCGLTRLCSILHSLSASFKSKLKKPCTFGEQINNKAKKKNRLWALVDESRLLDDSPKVALSYCNGNRQVFFTVNAGITHRALKRVSVAWWVHFSLSKSGDDVWANNEAIFAQLNVQLHHLESQTLYKFADEDLIYFFFTQEVLVWDSISTARLQIRSFVYFCSINIELRFTYPRLTWDIWVLIMQKSTSNDSS